MRREIIDKAKQINIKAPEFTEKGGDCESANPDRRANNRKKRGAQQVTDNNRRETTGVVHLSAQDLGEETLCKHG